MGKVCKPNTKLVKLKSTVAEYCQLTRRRLDVCTRVSHRVIFTGLELEVVCFVEHGILLHEQLLIELLYYLRGRQMRDY